MCGGYLELSGGADVCSGVSGAYLAWERNETSGTAHAGRGCVGLVSVL